MKVLSVNIARPGEIVVKERRVSTGIYKAPVEGPRQIGPLGLEGDRRVLARKFGEAHHAVHAYPFEHYAFWQERFSLEPIPTGKFGENLTVCGLLETEARVGDVLRVGTAVLQIAQFRIPCGKLTARMGVPKFARFFLESRRVGFYLRVLEPGAVTSGDAIELLERDAASPTVDEFVRISQFDAWDAAGIERLLGARDLMPAWREILQSKLRLAREADGWFGLRALEVTERVEECPGVTSLWLACPHGQPLAPFLPGQTLLVHVRPSPLDPVVRRAYAISSSPTERARYRITVRHVQSADPAHPAGAASTFLHGLRVGGRVRVTAPRGRFTLTPELAASPGSLFLSAGVGAAPIVSMLHAWADDPAAGPATWVRFERDGGSIPLGDDAAELSARRPLRVLRALSAPQAADRLGEDYELAGGIDEALTRATLPPAGGHVWVAGPRAFVERAVLRLEALGVEPRCVHRESFGGVPARG